MDEREKSVVLGVTTDRQVLFPFQTGGEPSTAVLVYLNKFSEPGTVNWLGTRRNVSRPEGVKAQAERSGFSLEPTDGDYQAAILDLESKQDFIPEGLIGNRRTTLKLLREWAQDKITRGF